MSNLKNDTLTPVPNEQAKLIAAFLVRVGLRLMEKEAAEKIAAKVLADPGVSQSGRRYPVTDRRPI